MRHDDVAAMTQAEFDGFVDELVENLPEKWMRMDVRRARSEHRAEIERVSDRMRVLIYRDQFGRPDRVSVVADWGDDTLENGRESLRMSAAHGRGAAAVAKDVQRRIVEPFAPLLTSAREAYRRRQEHLREAEALRGTIGEHLNAVTAFSLAHEVTGRDWWDRASAEFDVRVERRVNVQVTLKGLTSEQALVLARWVEENLVESA